MATVAGPGVDRGVIGTTSSSIDVQWLWHGFGGKSSTKPMDSYVESTLSTVSNNEIANECNASKHTGDGQSWELADGNGRNTDTLA